MKTLAQTLVVALVISVASSFSTAQTNGSTPQPLSESYEFTGPVFDIEATPDGGILVTEGTTIKKISSSGVEEVAEVPTIEGSAINGLKSIDQESFFATSAGLDAAVGAGLWRVTQGEAQMVANIGAFEIAQDPDAFAGPQWKNQACEDDAAQGFTAGPQTNPYHLTKLSESEALVADAAGNTLLSASTNGDVDWVAVFEPPVDENGDWRFLKTAENNPEVDCYVQPVPSSVDVGPDGAYYVGELTGAPGVPGWSRVWRIEPGARNVVCPSDDCQEVISGLTSVIDVLFGPDGQLYVVEMDENGWLSLIAGGAAGGAIKRCDVNTGNCTLVERADVPLGAITFDASGQLWVVENESLFGPGVATVRRVNP